ncbi:Mrp/NBP35 family ATP-binding protein [Bacteriovoracaceae bacterium]|nr:Mrp/NBP35 family ATP-binding protein [Bacteriovoracaceae bacterium]
MIQIEELKNITNPVTGKTLEEEKRWVDIKKEGETVTILFQRDGIDPKQKREIEDQIYKNLENVFTEENIFIKSVSKNSNDIFNKASTSESKPSEKAKQKAPQAQLNVGHGTVGQKKRVPNVKNVIAISSCKGGVGKSTFTANIACSLSRLGKKVGILDADIYGPSMPMLLGKRGEKPSATEDKKIKPIESNGLKFISFGLFIGEDDPVIWRGPMLGGVLNQFLFDVDWGELDYLLIDLPPGTGDMQLSMVQTTEVDGAIIISTPQSVALADTRKGMKMFEQVKVPIVGMIENMSYFVPEDQPSKKYYIFGEGGVKSTAKELDLNYLGEIPLLTNLRESADEGLPYMADEKNAGNIVFENYMESASEIDKLLSGTKKEGFFKKLFK